MKTFTTQSGMALALTAALTLGTPLFAQSGSMSGQDNTQGTAMLHGHREAMRMVPARADLLKTISAKKDQPGEMIEAKLAKTIHLSNGPELPAGTILMGTISNDDMQQEGMSKLALLFNKAKLKDGTVIPIKATIVGIAKPENDSPGTDYPVSAGDQVPNSWTDGTLQVDQIGVTSGVDLHSKIASKNSGVFVSKDKDNVTLRTGSEVELAIGAGMHGGMHSMSSGATGNMQQ